MGKSGDTFWDAAVFRGALSRWALSAREARQAKLSTLQRQSLRAKSMRVHIDELLQVADERLALPVEGSESFPKPHNADWAWRPNVWRGRLSQAGVTALGRKTALGPDLTVFHDCSRSEVCLRQLRNRSEDDLAPYGLRVDVFDFDGSFLSLALNFPEVAITDVKRNHIIQMRTAIEMEEPLELFARLNIRHGPNTEQIVRELPPGAGEREVEFDLAYCEINARRIEKVWIDLILENPRMNQVLFRDVTLNRRPRADV